MIEVGKTYSDVKGNKIKIIIILSEKYAPFRVIGANELGIKHMFTEKGEHYYDKLRNLII